MPTYQELKDAREWDSLHAAAAMPLDRSYGPVNNGNALRALGQVAGGRGGGGGYDGGPEDAPAGTMRPGLRNALADSAGMEALRQLERGKPERIDYHDGPADGAFGSRPEFYIPETMDPIADRETKRQAAVSDAYTTDRVGDIVEPGKYQRAAEGKDYAAGLEADRYWDPMTYSMRQDEDARKLERATAPASIAADSRNQVAETAAGGRMGVAQIQQPARDLSAIGAATKGGAFGTDPKTGDPIAPAGNPGLDAVARFMQPKFDPATESEISKGVNAGYSREEVVAHLKKIGRIK